MPESTSIPVRQSSGIGFAISAYALWGLMPVFFLLLAPASAFEIVAWRILFSLLFCAVLITVTRGWGRMVLLLHDRRTALTMGLAGIFILLNWLVYVYASLNGHVVEAALGYFINPIVTVLLGVLVLRERLRPLQWVSIGITAAAVIVLAVNYGAFPFIAIALAFTFGTYGLIKKGVGGRVDALSGLTLETLWLAPVAVGALMVINATSGLTVGTAGAGQSIATVATGVVTAVPLLLFAAAASRLPLTQLGLTQYVAPILQFLTGVFILGEAMPVARWIGFALIWVALIVLTVDMLLAGRTTRRAALVNV